MLNGQHRAVRLRAVVMRLRYGVVRLHGKGLRSQRLPLHVQGSAVNRHPFIRQVHLARLQLRTYRLNAQPAAWRLQAPIAQVHPKDRRKRPQDLHLQRMVGRLHGAGWQWRKAWRNANPAPNCLRISPVQRSADPVAMMKG